MRHAENDPSSRCSARQQSLRAALISLEGVPGRVPLVAFGQTALWDEPVKSMVAAETSRTMLVGVHDLDYFSRLRLTLPGPEWQIMARNDGSAREAWVAAGELSALFGCEAGPTRQALIRAGVRLGGLLPDEPLARQAAIDKLTQSWGWRGIMQNTAGPNVVCETPAAKILPSLHALLKWGFGETAKSLAEPAARKPVHRLLKQILDSIDAFIAEHPAASVSDLFRRLYEMMYELLLGRVPDNVRITCTRDLFRFNTRTARRGRFQFVRHFLCGKAAGTSRAAYDEAIAATQISTLASIGEHATPFDVYVPGRGRGMLHIARDFVRVDLPMPVTLALSERVQSVTALAEVLEQNFGPEISLVGKAVALPAMFGGEFIMVLNDTGSAYVPHTRQMLNTMKARGIRLTIHPILRLGLRTWNSLRATNIEFRLPPHLAHAFASETLGSEEFARRWKPVINGQNKLLKRLGGMLSPHDFVEFLGHEEHDIWFRRLERYTRANALLLEVQRQVDALRHQAIGLRRKEDAVREEIAVLEQQRGEFNRTCLRPLKRKWESMAEHAPAAEHQRIQREYATVAAQGDRLLESLEAKRKQRRRLVAQRKAGGNEIRNIEHGAKVQAARRTHRNVLRQSEEARLRLARNALHTVAGLSQGNARPSAWWLHAVDPSGEWFARMRATATGRVEPLMEDGN